jgi:hypothetical protein
MIVAACAVPVGLVTITAPDVAAEVKKAPVVMKGHPEKQSGAVAVPQVSKPMPAPRADKAPKATREDVSWVPGDYYWGGNDWAWDDGYWQDQPWSGALWVSGHWSQRWWGWTWVRGYWD